MDVDCYYSEYETEDTEWSHGCATYPCVVTTDHAASHYGQPVVVIDGEARGVAEMPPGEVQAPSQAIAVPLMNAGYRVVVLPADDMARYWAAAAEREMGDHWHPEARWVCY